MVFGLSWKTFSPRFGLIPYDSFVPQILTSTLPSLFHPLISSPCYFPPIWYNIWITLLFPPRRFWFLSQGFLKVPLLETILEDPYEHLLIGMDNLDCIFVESGHAFTERFSLSLADIKKARGRNLCVFTGGKLMYQFSRQISVVG